MTTTDNFIHLSLWIEENCPILGNTNSMSNRKLIHGVGLNDANFVVNPTINDKVIIEPSYQTWVSMILRAYSAKFQIKQPTYKNVSVCDEWLTFSNFRKWWLIAYKQGYHLDKDILSDGDKIYSPETCIYIPQWLNNFITARCNLRGKYKIGVYLDKEKGKYRSKCSNPITKRSEHLGYFENELDAHNAWLTRKLDLAFELKPEMDKLDTRIYYNVVEIIKLLC